MRILCIDFETNGFASGAVPKHENPRPWANYPIQVSVDAVVDGEVVHLYDTLILGASRLSRWVKENGKFTLQQLRSEGKPWRQVQLELADIVQEGDVVAAHHAEFDMERVYGYMLSKTSMEVEDDYGGVNLWAVKINRESQKMYDLPRICTMTDVFSKTAFGGKKPKLQNLCAHFNVDLLDAHDARADSKALAQCIAEAQRKEVVWQLRHKPILDIFEDVSDDDTTNTEKQGDESITNSVTTATQADSLRVRCQQRRSDASL